MSHISESEIEDFTLKLLEALGYEYLYGPDIAPDSTNPQRTSYTEVILHDKVKSAIQRLNNSLPSSVHESAFKELLRINAPDLITNNETFHRMLTEGIKVTYQKDGHERGDLIWLIDFDHPENNEFLVVNQFTVSENNINKRPDVILFVNGIPLVVMELKNAADENATIQSAYRQFQTYKAVIPSLFTYNAFLIISDGLEARSGTLSSGITRFMAWKSSDGRNEASTHVGQLETLIQGMLNKQTLLDLIRHFIVFESTKHEDLDTGIVTIKTIKKLAAYHQYYAVNKAVDSTMRASGYNNTNTSGAGMAASSSPFYGKHPIENQPTGDRKGGVVWHTQGSGKSLSMVFFTGKIVLKMNNPTIVVITDRNDLDDQLFETFGNSKQLLRQEPVQADNREELKKLLRVASGGVVFTTIQKFQPEEGNVYDQLSVRENIVVIADEAHRTQYGFKAKTIDDKENGQIVGKKIVYGFAKYMRDALPNATYLGFTGTPIENFDVNTPAVFGNYVDVYDIAQAVEDGATVRIYYESRLAKISLSEEGKHLVEELDDELFEDELSSSQKTKAKWTQLEALVGSKQRMQLIAKDIVTHFEQKQEVFDGKGMIVAMSRRIAAELYEEIIKLRPEWHDKDLRRGALKVVMTASSSDGPLMSNFHTTKDQRKTLAERMRNPQDPLKLVIVRDMWLTGFDVPNLHVLYIDKPMKGHNLMQAIARVNRVYKDKQGGLIVDYLGIASDLKKALSFYSDSGGKGDPAIAQEQAVHLMLEKLEVVSQMFHGYAYEDFFDADTGKKLTIILEAENHILGLENGKKRYLDEVTALSKAFSIAVPHEQAMDVKDEVSFFQAVKARLVKFVGPVVRDTEEGLDTAIKQVIDKALVSDKVIDVFDAAGIKKPDISILSEEFLMEVRDMEHKNIALEVLKKLLNDEIKARSKTNLVESKTLMEMLENSIRKYHNKIVSAVEVIDELISLSKEIKEMDKLPKELGLTEYEYAFYTAIASNNSAMELMGKDKLRELSVALYEQIKSNASIDWTIKESVKSKLKVAVKRTLRKYGYPPDMQKLATDTVLQQAEMIAEELSA